MNVKFNNFAAFLALLTITGSAMAGMVKEANARTQQERNEATAMIAAGAALLITIVGIPAGTALIAADNEDGSRTCWTKVLDRSDIEDNATYETYKRMGIPVEELFKHTNAAIYGPNQCSRVPRVVVRNRRAEQFTLRPTVNDPDFMMYHAEHVPKMLTWPAKEDEEHN